VKAQDGWGAASNDLQRGGLKAERDAAVCAAIPNLQATDWTGVIRTIDANGEGKGVITIEVAENVQIKTWNTAFSDIMDETLVDPASPVFAAALKKAEGDVVTFSGEFISGEDAGCVRESSLTLSGAVQDPQFIFRFSGLR